MEKKLYELTYWLRLEIQPEQEEEKILNLLKSNEIDVVERFIPRKRRLSYSIEKQIIGYLGTIYFTADPNAIDQVKAELLRYKNILRFMVIKRKLTTLDKDQGNKILIPEPELAESNA